MTAYGQIIGTASRKGGIPPSRELAATLSAHSLGDNAPSVIIDGGGQDMESYGINPQGGQMLPFDRECGETLAIGHGGGVMTLNPYDVQSIRVNTIDGIMHTQSANGVKSGLFRASILDDRALSAMRFIVRRLTPMECERLQGLPDRWTIPAFKPEEITDALVAEFGEIHNTFARIMAEYANAKPPKPKTEKQVRKWLEKIANPATCPDAPRYKACGNGWATNQPRWILLRLIAEDNKVNEEVSQ